jgi:hypothetical protein
LHANSSEFDLRVGILKARLAVRESRSLKDKRAVVKGLKDRLRSRFNVSVSEVGALDNRQIAQLAVAFVSNDGKFVQSVLSKVLDFIRLNPFAELTYSEVEIF